MIWESGPWKEELAKAIRRLEINGRNLLSSDGELGNTDVLVERDLLTSAFIVRKLWDSLKLSIRAELQSVYAYRYPLVRDGVFPDNTNWDRVEDFYNLEKGEGVHLPLRNVVNQLIHSYVLLTVVDDDPDAQGHKLTGFFCASDTARKRGLCMIPWHAYKKCLEVVANDDVVFHRVIRSGAGESIELRSDREYSEAEIDNWEAEHREDIQKIKQQRQEFLGVQ